MLCGLTVDDTFKSYLAYHVLKDDSQNFHTCMQYWISSSNLQVSECPKFGTFKDTSIGLWF